MDEKPPVILSVPLSSVQPDPANVRRHGARNLAAIQASLRRFGQQKPIVVDERGVIRAGNGTYEAARQLGWTHIHIIRTPLTGPDAIAYAIADNRTGDLAQWDEEALNRQIAALDGDLLSAAGFNQAELAKLMETGRNEPVEKMPPEIYELAVGCANEADQKQLFERLTGEGRTCRVLTI